MIYISATGMVNYRVPIILHDVLEFKRENLEKKNFNNKEKTKNE